MLKSEINKKDNSTYNMIEDTENSKGCEKKDGFEKNREGRARREGARVGIYAKSPEPYYDPTEYTHTDDE